eukprot:snap_masked-scaffold_10-processed-gene-13.8-mRNA-1 protein AED:1.00 eAED:1.00 QI:0/-1/0/0/-1/1/1/0/65
MLEKDMEFNEEQVLSFLTAIRDVLYLRNSNFFPSLTSFDPSVEFGANIETRDYLCQLVVQSSVIE